MLVALVSALLNLVAFVVVPFAIYAAYHKLRHKRTFAEIRTRAGLQVGETRYVAYCAVLAFVTIAVLVLAPPSLEPLTRPGSPQHDFVGLGFGARAVELALLYGVLKTGFAEEFLFRGLIAGSLGRRLPLVSANLIQAAIFLLPHLLVLKVMPEMWPILPLVFVTALFMGWVRIKSGSILGPWLVHAVANVTICLSVAARTAQ